ncbi:c-type cytochrome biogenesis protein CcsB [Fuchsiella alkaliacetigena]|uniref:c-type cytochrome biogenesis protein CcsB n=1 Tax=Fuchsiella alkaliacetigena TaxID=957042 RepID=UPI002009EED7|nr:c-type cytochrome biogenesis protein CcsB [Fuchsiella alkaliacetigena]MCK8824442.1 c-type cytochrome biogenesis protein CcsB [Fuchsiella alkaliacetigena]
MAWSRGLLWLTLAIYFFSSIIYIKQELIQAKQNNNRKIAYLFQLGALIHTFCLLAIILETGYLPIKNLYETLLLFSWTIVIIYNLIEYLYKFKVLGAFIIPLNTIAIFYASFLPNNVDNLPMEMRSIWLSIHTSVIFFGYGVFTLAFCVSVAYLIQEKQLQEKKPSMFYYRLPALNKLDKLSLRLVMIGFPLLTIGVLAGVIWSGEIKGVYWTWNAKQIWTTITWLIYALYLHNRFSKNWQGRKSAYITIIGFLAILFTYLGLAFLPVEFHDFTQS